MNFDSLSRLELALVAWWPLIGLLVLVLSWVAFKSYFARIYKPLEDLAVLISTIANSPGCPDRASEQGATRVVGLARAFNTMLDSLQNNAKALNQALKQSKLNEAQLDHLAHSDQVTGLPNRIQFHRELARAAERAKRHANNFAVVYLDLDDFKVVNDTLGHDVGDQLLRAVGQRLTETVRKSDLVCRLGGDEFTVLLEGITGLGTVVDIVSKLVEVLAKGFELGDQTLYIKASAGVAIFPEQTDDIGNILRFADLAMYRAKNEGKNDFCFYTSNLLTQADERRVIERELRHGIENDEFFLVYQPQVAIQTGRIEGMEALLRWQHPLRGLVTPGDFIDVAEKSGLIVPLGRKVLSIACEQWAEWRDQGVNPPRLSVNVSGLQLSEESFAEELMTTLAAYGYPKPLLELEITESLLLSDTRVSKAMMHRLAGSGIEWALDDFGTGYSSLTYLTKFPIKKIKIDRSFIANLPGSTNSAAIVNAVIALAQGLGMKVVAEGVETQQQAEYLATKGEIVAQSYYFHRPLPPSEIAKLLFDQNALGAF